MGNVRIFARISVIWSNTGNEQLSLLLIACSCVEFVLPFVTVATINVLIYLNIRRRSRGLMMASSLSTAVSSSSAALDADDSQTTTAKAKKLLTRDKKSARSLAILIIVFLFTWAPYEIFVFQDTKWR